MSEIKNTIGYTDSRDFRCLEDLRESGVVRVSNSLNLDYCGMERCQNGYAFGPFVRESYVIHIITKGKGQLHVGPKTYDIHENQAFLLRPGIETVYQADKEDPWCYYWIGFHGSKSETVIYNMGFTHDMDVIDLRSAEMLADHILHIMDHRELTMAHNLKRNAYFAMILAEIIEDAQVPDRKEVISEETYVQMAIEEIEANFNHTVTVSGIAGKIGINRSYLSIIFKKHIGLSPQQYLIRYRMERAASLLLEKDQTIRAVASFVGYTDSLTFSKAFKKQYGFSPSEFRKNPPALLNTESKGSYHGIRKL